MLYPDNSDRQFARNISSYLLEDMASHTPKTVLLASLLFLFCIY
jgi:hypothetical protein